MVGCASDRDEWGCEVHTGHLTATDVSGIALCCDRAADVVCCARGGCWLGARMHACMHVPLTRTGAGLVLAGCPVLLWFLANVRVRYL